MFSVMNEIKNPQNIHKKKALSKQEKTGLSCGLEYKSADLFAKKAIIGIIGGAGPDATVDLQIKILRSIKRRINVMSDQDHYQIIVDNNSCLADRTSDFYSTIIPSKFNSL